MFTRRLVGDILSFPSLADSKIALMDIDAERLGLISVLCSKMVHDSGVAARNTDLITNLPHGCCVEVPCLVDSLGVHPCQVGDLPEQSAALIQTNINVQRLTVESILEGERSKKSLAGKPKREDK